MGRTKANNVTSTVDKAVEVAKNENEEIVDTTISEAEEKTDKADKKAKAIKDDDEVEIICKELAGKSVVGLDCKNPIKFDEKGKAKTSGLEAKRLITIPGYSLA